MTAVSESFQSTLSPKLKPILPLLLQRDFSGAAAWLNELALEEITSQEAAEALWCYRLIGKPEQGIEGIGEVNRFAYQEALWNEYGLSLACTAQTSQAVAWYQNWLNLSPDHAIATYQAQTFGESIPLRIPTEYLASLGDLEACRVGLRQHVVGYASASLVDNLWAGLGTERVHDILDFGCGVGGLASNLRNKCQVLDGVDASPESIRCAQDTGFYDSTICEDGYAFLLGHRERYDAIIAIDAFTSFGDLSEILPACFESLNPNGWLLFTLHEGPLAEDSYFLTEAGEFMHSPQYLIEQLGNCGVPGGTIKRAQLEPLAPRTRHSLAVAVKKPKST